MKSVVSVRPCKSTHDLGHAFCMILDHVLHAAMILDNLYDTGSRVPCSMLLVFSLTIKALCQLRPSVLGSQIPPQERAVWPRDHRGGARVARGARLPWLGKVTDQKLGSRSSEHAIRLGEIKDFHCRNNHGWLCDKPYREDYR